MLHETTVQSSRIARRTRWERVTSSTFTETEILILVKKGDSKAYQIIVQKYMQTAYYIALGFVHNQQDALDLSQDTFIKAFRKIKSFDTSRPFFPWFYRILKNICIDHFKRVRHRNEIPLEENTFLTQEKEDKEMKAALWQGIEKLSFEQKEMIILRYFREFSYQEIAEITGKPIGSVMSSLHYAKKRLKEVAGKYLGFEKD
ncbi:RNA polymerase sigma factor [Acidobacteriota bacterium]